MIDLTEWQEGVNKALEDGTPCLLAAADKEGHPDIAIKGSMMIFDKDHMAWWERSLGEQILQVEQNPHVVIFYRNGRTLMRVYGDAKIHKEGPVREAIHEKTIDVEKQKDPEKKGYGVLVTVNRVRMGSNTVQERE
ncbi:MAG TPA: pyridoxamine 5'-phosphate oxidase family protein [Chloroflexota bacterium]